MASPSPQSSPMPPPQAPSPMGPPQQSPSPSNPQGSPMGPPQHHPQSPTQGYPPPLPPPGGPSQQSGPPQQNYPPHPMPPNMGPQVFCDYSQKFHRKEIFNVFFEYFSKVVGTFIFLVSFSSQMPI